MQKRHSQQLHVHIQLFNDKMEWEGIQFLTFPTIWCQIPSAQGHVTHKVSSEHAQTTGSSH